MSSLHGGFYTDAVFGGSSWSADGELFVYTAQMKEIDTNGGVDITDYADFGEGYTGYLKLNLTHLILGNVIQCWLK